MKIKNNSDIIQYIQDQNQFIFGVGVNPYNRFFFSFLGDNYQILSLRDTKDFDVVNTVIPVHSVEHFINEKVFEVKKNSNSVIKNSNIKEIINKHNQIRRPILIPYKGRTIFQDIANANNYIAAIGSYEVSGNLLEDKERFRTFLNEKNLDFAPKNIIQNVAQLVYEEIAVKVGSRSFVIQIPKSGGGKGTFFVHKSADLPNVIKKINSLDQVPQNVVVSSYIKGTTLSISCVATKWGTLVSKPQVQIQDIPQLHPKEKGEGVFNGHDWSFSKEFQTSKIISQSFEIGQKIGDAIYKMGYRGFFGLDLIVDETTQQVYVLECNPRLTGVMPSFELLSETSDSPSLMLLHILEFMDNTSDINVEIKSMQENIINSSIKGAHFFVYSLFNQKTYYNIDIKPGIYSIGKNEELVYERSSVHPGEIKDSGEFIICEIITSTTPTNRYSRMLRVVTTSQVLRTSYEFNEFGKAIVASIRKLITISKQEAIVEDINSVQGEE